MACITVALFPMYSFSNMLVMEARVSSCELEADVLAADILNREEVDMCKSGTCRKTEP